MKIKNRTAGKMIKPRRRKKISEKERKRNANRWLIERRLS